jgi:hypothetical protein
MSDINQKPDVDEAIKSVQEGLMVIDTLRLEKFNLKRQIVQERSRFNDLRTAFLELKQELIDKEYDLRYSNTRKLIDEKKSLQQTVKALSNEVEQLSIMNEELLVNLQKEDFYYEFEASQAEYN